MEKIQKFCIKHKVGLTSCICGLVAGALAALAILSTIMFGYYKIQPQDTVDITIKQANIQGTKEDGSPINGFIIIDDNDVEYLVTDYWNPIMLSDSLPKEQ